jgi:hypothetical protein
MPARARHAGRGSGENVRKWFAKVDHTASRIEWVTAPGKDQSEPI